MISVGDDQRKKINLVNEKKKKCSLLLLFLCSRSGVSFELGLLNKIAVSTRRNGAEDTI